MTTDFRALCAELMEALDEAAPGINQFRDLRDRADAALADEPAAPQGREPAAVTRRPSDEDPAPTPAEEVMGPTYDDLSKLCSKHGLDVDDWPLERFDALWEVSRAILARWGNPAAAPAGVLVSRVAQSLTAVFQNGPYAEGANRWDEQAASAAIREVAKWLDGQDYTGTSATPGNIAEWLRQELENNG